MDESRLQRIEDKIDRLSEVAIQNAVLQQEMLTVQKQQDWQAKEGKERADEIAELKKLVSEIQRDRDVKIEKLENKLHLVIKVGGFAVLILIAALTGINLL